VKHFLLIIIAIMALIDCRTALARKHSSAPQHTATITTQNEGKALQCAAFSPYVGKLSPNYGPAPSKELINELLDRLIENTPFRCIMTYGVLNGLDTIFASAEARKIKVIAILWIDKEIEVNSLSIAKGIEVAKAYPKTIIKLSCGSEVRTRHGNKFDGEISRCIDSLRKANVKQPITTIDVWWQWCNRSVPCQQNSFTDSVDWIGANIFPWWENKNSGLYPCVTAEKSADFHIARLEELRKTYPKKDVVVTEFGWPNAPEGGTETNTHTGEHCGVANSSNQKMVVRDTFKKLAEHNWSGVVFEAFSEGWKPANEGNFGNSWGVCRGAWPYGCMEDILGISSTKTVKANKKPK
jgi:exo-beta-1,3-glucanase (GH17 family)